MDVTQLLLPDVREAIEKDPKSLAELVEELHSADLAAIAAELEPDQVWILFRALPAADAAELLEAMELQQATEIFRRFAEEDVGRAGALADDISPDDRADLMGELPEELRRAILARMQAEEQRNVRQLLSYAEGTAGALMTTNFVALPVEFTVAQAIEQLRRSAEEMETINDAYAVDKNGTLMGALSLRDLLLARGNVILSDLMEPNVISANVDEDQEEIARIIARYDFLALPIVDRHRHIVGIITVDDVVDVLEEEATEDAQRMGAVQPLEDTYFSTGLWEFIRKRAPWLIVLFLAGFATTAAMKHITAAFDQYAPLLWFVPLIIAAGGNAGAQSGSLMIRALALGEVKPSDYARVMTREIFIGLILGLMLGILGATRALGWAETRTSAVLETVGLTLIVVVTLGAVIGSGFPLLLRRLGMDPATASVPFITSVTDVFGLLVYFGIANLLLF